MSVFSFRINSSGVRALLTMILMLTFGVASAPLFAAPITDAANDLQRIDGDSGNRYLPVPAKECGGGGPFLRTASETSR